MKLDKQEKDLLAQASAIRELAGMPGWENYLRPWLEAKRDESFPDPLSTPDKEKFYHKAVVASALKKATAEIIVFVESQKEAFDTLSKKKNNKSKVNKFEIGRS